MQSLFPLGRTVATPRALLALERTRQEAREFLARHHRGDWGEALGAEDWQANDNALVFGERLLSAYYLRNGQKVWIITERDRSVTTVLLPSEY